MIQTDAKSFSTNYHRQENHASWRVAGEAGSVLLTTDVGRAVYGCMLRDRLCRITLSRKHLSLFILPTADGNYSRLADALRFIDSVVIVHQNHIYLSK